MFAILSAVFPFVSGLFVLLSREKGYSYLDLSETEEETETEEITNTDEEIFFND